MTEIRSAAVIGLGLMGGSLARDLAARGVRVLGRDRDEVTVAKALREGVISDAIGDGFEGGSGVDLVVVGVPVREAVQVLTELRPHLDGVRLVTDLGSTKASVVQAAEALGIGERFVGSHPLAGSHESGWDASREGLFSDERIFVCPTPSSSDASLAAARELWTSVGGRVVEMEAAAHDRYVAWISHLPQAVSTALGRVLAERRLHRIDDLGPGGQGMTRLAGSSPEMWTQIALDNAPSLYEALRSVEEELADLRLAVAAGDEEAVRAFFTRGRSWFKGEGG